MDSNDRVRLFATPWTIQSMEFSGKNWSGLPFPSPEDLPDPGIEPGFPALQADSLPTEPPVFNQSCLHHTATAAK